MGAGCGLLTFHRPGQLLACPSLPSLQLLAMLWRQQGKGPMLPFSFPSRLGRRRMPLAASPVQVRLGCTAYRGVAGGAGTCKGWPWPGA